MIEWFFSGIVRVLAWLWTSALTLYYLAGFFVVTGGLILFTASVIHHFWKKSQYPRTSPASSNRINIHIVNLNVTVELTEAQARSLLSGDRRALPSAFRCDDGDGAS